MHNVDEELGSVFGKVIDQESALALARGDLFNPRNDPIRN